MDGAGRGRGAQNGLALADRAPQTAQHGDVEVAVALDAGEQTRKGDRDGAHPRRAGGRMVADNPLCGRPENGARARRLRGAGNGTRSSVAENPAIASLVLVLVLGAALAACERGREADAPPPRVKQVFHLNAYEKDFGLSQAVLIDKTMYISGSVAADQNGRLVAPGDMAGQMRAAYSNVQRTLAAHGAGFDDIVRETIFTTDMDALLKASDLRFEYYNKERLPTTSWVQVQRLVDPGFLVEIEVIAELP